MYERWSWKWVNRHIKWNLVTSTEVGKDYQETLKSIITVLRTTLYNVNPWMYICMSRNWLPLGLCSPTTMLLNCIVHRVSFYTCDQTHPATGSFDSHIQIRTIIAHSCNLTNSTGMIEHFLCSFNHFALFLRSSATFTSHLETLNNSFSHWSPGNLLLHVIKKALASNANLDTFIWTHCLGKLNKLQYCWPSWYCHNIVVGILTCGSTSANY